MENSTLLKLSFIVSIVGIFILLIILEYQEIPFYQIKDITKDHLEKSVKIQGTIITIKETPGLYLLKVKDTKIIPVMIFKEEEIDIKKNSKVEIEGKVTEYKNELEIIADKITELK
jgi:RecJ-like exonuclease